MPRLYADLHCHSTMYSFNRMRHTPAEADPLAFHPWNVMPSNLEDMARGKRGATYAQSSPEKLAHAGCRLVFTSFTPIEKGFFQGNHGPQERYPLPQELLRLVTGQTLVSSLLHLARRQPFEALAQWTRPLKNRSPLRRLIQTMVMRYSPQHIQHLMSDEYDYWQEFLKEYDFLRRVDGQTYPTTLTRQDHAGRPEQLPMQGCLCIIQDRAQLQSLIQDHDRREIAMVLTIEGGHVLSVAPDQSILPKAQILERVEQLKRLPHPIFFVTLAHHFDNGLCGHAHSIPDAARLVMDQSVRMNEGFERHEDLGLSVARALLDLDEDLEPRGDRRVLIDCKHMSALTRKEYYDQIIDPYLARFQTWDRDKQARFPVLPVLFSHAAYAGVATLDAFIRDAHLEHDRWHQGPFYAWNINLCDEDVRKVHQTRGLIGLVFEQRVAGVKPMEGVPAELLSEILVRQLLAMVDVIMLDERYTPEQRASIWDCICLGTDYDGFIDPISRYPTVLDLDLFARDLERALDQRAHTRQIASLGVQDLVEKICWRNAYEFTLRHLDAATSWPASP